MKEARIPDICRIQYGFAFDSAQFSATTGKPLIRIRDVVRGYSETYTTEQCGEEYVVNNGDLLIGMDGEFNIARWKGGPALLNQRVCRLFPKGDIVDEGYLFYFMPQALKQIEDKTPFVTVKHLSAKQLNSIVVPLPALEKQKQIASSLDKLSSLIFLRSQQLAKLDELVKARFVEMFGTLTTTKFSVKTLNELCLFIKDGTHQTPTYTEDSENGIKFLSSKDVTSGQIDWTKIKYIPQDLHEELYARIAPQRGDILLAKNGTTGIPAIVDTDDVFDIYVSLALLRFKDGNNITYLWAALSTLETKRQFDSSLKGIGVPNLHLSEIKKAKIIVPPIELQNKFSSFVEKIKRQKLTIQQSLDKLEVLKKSLMQEYFG